MLRFLKDGPPIFMSRLTEDSVYYIKYFQVCNARPNYRPIDYPYMAHFTTHTQIHQVKTVPAHFPQYAYNLSTSEELHQRCGITEYCSGDKYITIFLCSLCAYGTSYIYIICASHTDAIGIFTGCSHVKQQQTSKGTKPLRNVTLTDGRYYHISIASFHYCYSLYYSFN